MQSFTHAVDGFHDVGYQMTLDLRRRAEEHFRRQEVEKAAIADVASFEAHRDRVRAHFLNAIGGLPGPQDHRERGCSPVRVTGRLERPGFTVEKLIYQSLPEFPVTAACYVPRGLEGPAPAVIMAHGHAAKGKSYSNYQAVCQDLVSNGFLVLAIDPIGQGERYQVDADGSRLYASCTEEHTRAGIPFWLRGSSIARYFIWDIMRGIDYLESRADVDPASIGITGSSGGGTQTCYLMLCEPRLAAAVPCTFVTTLDSLQKTGRAQDAEQTVPGCMVHGPDHDDYLTAFAPRPVLVGAAAWDFFPIEGTREAVCRARNIYALYGCDENVGLTVAPTPHEYSAHLRQACVNWFRQHLRGDAPDFQTDDTHIFQQLFEEQELWATAGGCVYIDEPNAKTIVDLAQGLVKGLAPSVPNFETESGRSALAEVLGIARAGERHAPIDARVFRNEVIDGYRTEKIFFFSTPHIVVTGVLVHPRDLEQGAVLPATLLLLEHGTDDIAARRPLLESLLGAEQRVFVFDVRGTGAVRETGWLAEAEETYHNHAFKLESDAMMLGLSTLGLRVFDVLRGADYLRTRTDVSSVQVRGAGSGEAPAYYAALLEPGLEGAPVETAGLVSGKAARNGPPDLSAYAWGLHGSSEVAASSIESSTVENSTAATS